MRYAKPDQPRDERGRWARESVGSVESTVFDSEPGKNFREKAAAWAQRELVGKSFTNEDTSMTIGITNRSIKKTLRHMPNRKPGMALKLLPSLLQEAVWVDQKPPRDAVSRTSRRGTTSWLT